MKHDRPGIRRFVGKAPSTGEEPVYWCAACQTALAEAEVEYEDHKSLPHRQVSGGLDFGERFPAPQEQRSLS